MIPTSTSSSSNSNEEFDFDSFIDEATDQACFENAVMLFKHSENIKLLAREGRNEVLTARVTTEQHPSENEELNQNCQKICNFACTIF